MVAALNRNSLPRLENPMNELEPKLQEAETKAWDSLARYKFLMFGYWAAIWVHLNRAGKFSRPNPFLQLVRAARERKHDH